MDMWSGFCIAVPCKTQDAEESLGHIQKSWNLKHGFPRSVLADQAAGFTSKFFEEIMTLFEAEREQHIAAGVWQRQRGQTRESTRL